MPGNPGPRLCHGSNRQRSLSPSHAAYRVPAKLCNAGMLHAVWFTLALAAALAQAGQLAVVKGRARGLSPLVITFRPHACYDTGAATAGRKSRHSGMVARTMTLTSSMVVPAPNASPTRPYTVGPMDEAPMLMV